MIERMVKMNLADIIALAKQGYKPQDIKDLIALAGSEDAGAGSEDAGAGAGSEDAGAGAGSEDAGAGAGSEDAGGGAGSEDAGGGAGSEDAGGGAGKSEMEQLVDQLRQQNKNLQDALKRMDLSKNVKTESASDILKETLTSLF
jgi:hypothetical protein